MSAAAESGAPPTTDLFLGGLVTLIQPRSGHRAGLDAALLQALVPADAEGHAVDLGTGAGAVALALAARVPGLRVTGIERDPELTACARAALEHLDNVAFADRVNFVAADVGARRMAREAAGLADHSADWVLMNPPFYDEATVRASPDPNRRAAHVTEAGTLRAWCRTASGLLKPGGRLGIIHRPSALGEILAALAGRFGGVALRPIHPEADAPAGRLLIEAVGGSRASLQILPCLVLHGETGAWTEAADAILRGRATA